MAPLRTILHRFAAIMTAAVVVWPAANAPAASGKPAPEIAAEHWINSRPLTLAGLKGRVVLVEFWTYG